MAHKRLGGLLSLLFWIAVWQLASMLISQQLFLASPLTVLSTLWRLLGTAEFYRVIGFSFVRICLGFLAGMLTGTALAAAAYKLAFIETLLRPLMGAVKTAPVASFVVLALLFAGSGWLSALIAFLMVVPIFYSNLLAGLKSVEPERFEAAAVFGMVNSDRFRFIYLPYVVPFFSGACEVGIGTAWKAGISAEVIGIASGSIGEKIYDAKINLETPELFAYTLAAIVISLVLERAAIWLIHFIEKTLTDGLCR